MIVKIAEYSIIPDKEKIIKKAIRKFLKAIEENESETFYEAFQKKDSYEFVHIMKFADAKSEKSHAKAAYTREFVEVLYPLCEIPPFFEDLKKI